MIPRAVRELMSIGPGGRRGILAKKWVWLAQGVSGRSMSAWSVHSQGGSKMFRCSAHAARFQSHQVSDRFLPTHASRRDQLNLTPEPTYDPVEVAENFKCPNPDYCYGYENTDSNGYYLATVKLSCAKTNVQLLQDKVLQGIVAYDRCTRNDAYVGQINMITVSSFAGPNSGVWGMDYALNPTLRDPKNLLETRTTIQLAEASKATDLSIPLKVYDVKPLLEATEALFGNVDNRKRLFPPLPGAHVPCAAKLATSEVDSAGNPVPGYVWSYIALAIADDRANDSSLFAEDCGAYPSLKDDPLDSIVPYLDNKRQMVVNSVILCGLNQQVNYKEVFVGYKYLYCGPNEYGVGLACAPYVLLAGSAYPNGGAQSLVRMNLTEWAEAVLPKDKVENGIADKEMKGRSQKE